MQELKKERKKDQVRSCDYAKVLYCGSIKIRKRIKLNTKLAMTAGFLFTFMYYFFIYFYLAVFLFPFYMK